jgi:hypothetical protein
MLRNLRNAASEGSVRSKVLIFCVVCIGLAGTAFADTLHLKNGQVINGVIAGRSSAGVQFTGPDGRTETYPFQDIESMSFGPPPAPPAPPPPAPERITVPAGTVLFVRMVDGLDTSSAYTGQVFTATLATNLAANGYVVANAGTTVYGRVVEANSAGRARGKSQLQLELTQIVIAGTPNPIMTNVFDTEGKSSASSSLQPKRLR